MMARKWIQRVLCLALVCFTITGRPAALDMMGAMADSVVNPIGNVELEGTIERALWS